MTIFEDRIRDAVWIFLQLFNITEDYSFHGLPIRDWLPFIQKDLAKMINDNPEKAEPILDWLCDAIFYCRGEIDSLPQVDIEFKKPE